MFNPEQLTAIIQFLKSSTGKALLDKVLQVAGGFIKNFSVWSKEPGSHDFESTKSPSYSAISATGLETKTASITTFGLGILLGLTFAFAWHRF